MIHPSFVRLTHNLFVKQTTPSPRHEGGLVSSHFAMKEQLDLCHEYEGNGTCISHITVVYIHLLRANSQSLEREAAYIFVPTCCPALAIHILVQHVSPFAYILEGTPRKEEVLSMQTLASFRYKGIYTRFMHCGAERGREILLKTGNGEEEERRN